MLSDQTGSGVCIQRGDTEQRDGSHPGRMEQDHARFHHAAQNGTQLKTYELFIFGISL